jgi:hypothetical protein
MPQASDRSGWRRVAGRWPWVLLALAVAPAVWLFVRFESEPDGEFPRVVRPTFSPRPPAAYRWAEPGDTTDRIGLYASAATAALAAVGWAQSVRAGRRSALWPAALGLALAAGWHAATPWPTFDGWHGWNWRSAADPATPWGVKAALVGAALALASWVAAWVFAARRSWPEFWAVGRERGCLTLLAVALLGVSYRIVGVPDAEPFGYWPRWAFAWGMMAFGFALVRALPAQARGWRRLAWTSGAVAATLVLIQGGLWTISYHRPIDRLRAVVPGRIFISAMPMSPGMDVAHDRHKFRTIINLFDETSPRRSPHHPAERAFAEKHGIAYYQNPSDPLQADEFLDLTLSLAQDPNAWPILVHCHGCMDRTPAWMGIYRFVVQGRPLEAILREIEGHRGLRPKASVTLLYNRVLAPRAPDRYRADPTAQLLNRNAAGTVDPYYEEVRAATARAQDDPPSGRLSRREPPSRRP